MNKHLLESIGFVLEVMVFITAGFYLGRGAFMIFFMYASIGVIIAVYVGQLIQENALEDEYKK